MLEGFYCLAIRLLLLHPTARQQMQMQPAKQQQRREWLLLYLVYVLISIDDRCGVEGPHLSVTQTACRPLQTWKMQRMQRPSQQVRG